MFLLAESSFTELGAAQTLALMLGIDLNDVNQAATAISVVNDVVSGKEDGDGVGIIKYETEIFPNTDYLGQYI